MRSIGHNSDRVADVAADELDEHGFVVDFGELHYLADWIDENLDHRMILQRGDPLIEAIENLGQHVYVIEENPTTENLARLLYEQTELQGFPVVSVTLWETSDSYATYTPKCLPKQSKNDIGSETTAP